MRWNRSNRLSLALGLAATAALLLHSQPGYAQAPLFTGIPYLLPYGADLNHPFAVSDDGSTVVGLSIGTREEGFVWTREGGTVGLGHLAFGVSGGGASGVSADGSVIVGLSQNASGEFEAFRWTSEGGMVGLGDLPGGSFYSRAVGVSTDGATVLISGTSEERQYEPVIWTTEGGLMDGLGSLPGDPYVQLGDLSADGGTVVGYGFSEAFRWTSEGGMVGLGFLPGEGSSIAKAVSGDGSIVVGISGDDPFRWTSESGMVSLGRDPFYDSAHASSLSSDGSTVGGGRHSSNPSTWQAWIEDAANGRRALRDVLSSHGIDVKGWTLAEVTDISGDGRVFVGWGYNPEGKRQAWVAVLADPAFMPALHPGASALLLCLLGGAGAIRLRLGGRNQADKTRRTNLSRDPGARRLLRNELERDFAQTVDLAVAYDQVGKRVGRFDLPHPFL